MLTPSVLMLLVAARLAGPTDEKPSTSTFPDAWAGTWRGGAALVPPGPEDAASVPNTFSMELRVGEELPRTGDEPRRWPWTIVYSGVQGRQERAYELVERDAAKGQYAIDEKNSIVLPATHLGGTLVSPFEIAGSMLVSTYRFDAGEPGPEDDAINVEIVTIHLPRPEVTGGREGAPEVKGFTVRTIQRATLRRE